MSGYKKRVRNLAVSVYDLVPSTDEQMELFASPTHAVSEAMDKINEEQIVIGKQDVSRGRVRIRSYVVETPVEERVTLHQERVDIERRPVDRPIEPGEEAFRERVIEATETSEEAVVSKEAQVREEVVVRKEAEERTETVHDTVRRTEVEIEDEKGRTQPASTGTTKRDDSA
jgi:uncharacterized protein (TIGR02271 family)